MPALRSAKRNPQPALHRVLFALDPGSAERAGAQSNGGTCAAEHLGRNMAAGCRVCVTVPVRTISAINAREHWAVRAKRVKAERRATAWALRVASAEGLLDREPIVRLTRLMGPRGRMLDDDNLRSALKSVRDAVAEWLRADDADERITWVYAQPERAAQWGVRVEVFA